MHATNHPATGEHAGRLRAWFRRQDPISAWMTIIGWGCYVLAALLLAWVAGAVVHNDVLERSTADHVASAPAAWPDATKRAVLQRARAYNGTLADRFGGRIPADAADEQGNPQELADAAYMRALSVDGGGAMARLSIPKISVNIAVYHTTLDDVLSKGAGHIYGTALPVGDPHTYTVLAAHSGGVQGMLFTRLSEMRQGDVFYLDVLGESRVPHHRRAHHHTRADGTHAPADPRCAPVRRCHRDDGHVHADRRQHRPSARHGRARAGAAEHPRRVHAEGRHPDRRRGGRRCVRACARRRDRGAAASEAPAWHAYSLSMRRARMFIVRNKTVRLSGKPHPHRLYCYQYSQRG